MRKKLSETEPYPPSEDTFFLADYIKNEKGECALDIGTGSGYLAALLEKSFSLVVGTDLVFNVLKRQEYFTTNNVCCNGADAINQQFDLVICNMPYLNTDDVINEGKYVTYDIGGNATTTQMADAISAIAKEKLRK